MYVFARLEIKNKFSVYGEKRVRADKKLFTS